MKSGFECLDCCRQTGFFPKDVPAQSSRWQWVRPALSSFGMTSDVLLTLLICKAPVDSIVLYVISITSRTKMYRPDPSIDIECGDKLFTGTWAGLNTQQMNTHEIKQRIIVCVQEYGASQDDGDRPRVGSECNVPMSAAPRERRSCSQHSHGILFWEHDTPRTLW